MDLKDRKRSAHLGRREESKWDQTFVLDFLKVAPGWVFSKVLGVCP
jgi:hypothetical protein